MVERGHDHRCKTTVEESLVGSHGSNGIVEKPVGVMKLALESSIWTWRRGSRLSWQSYAWYIINRLDVEKDGKAAYERVRGKSGDGVYLRGGEGTQRRVLVGNRIRRVQGAAVVEDPCGRQFTRRAAQGFQLVLQS